MKSAELDKLIQKVTDQVLVELNANNKLVIDSNNEWELYPTWFQKMVSADFRCQSNAKQDSNAILLCLSKLSLNDMLAISNLVAINDRCEKVLDYVIKGLPVWIIGKEEDYLKQKKNQRYAVYKRIEYALEEIKKYGITLISNKQELKENILIIKKQNEKRIPKRFITLREVQERSNKGIKLLKDFEVPTDLAKEWIAKRGDNHEY
ncbi:hypothetical protein DB324_08175 [Limosilactobacillus reuteri]|uniref:hypothetical protein n=1 Tax=Limosilactobacillus reuteri TaxID=1598 RepID=UPI000C1B6FB3|nr:hypothetical protein [Limosilactobacillus reuteri]MDW5473929.1 hypothetical protein [Limosilactobacillus reuteri]PIN29828.1 hypothetical protein CUC10_08150 [Limosilactobacillus reuteri]PUH33296.1 hypothetical protein DB323_08180 [Limosilactobacillus reuteri]PUH33732.1 hypothetical protein DB324_08175 [Limosilactobacillus reuteri]WLC95614.1 hypothetical protein LDE72_09035 [Limosilactobacillus reuteri]